MKKKLIRAANKIAQWEQQIALGRDVERAEEEIQKIAESLSIEEMLEIDNYISNKNILRNVDT